MAPVLPSAELDRFSREWIAVCDPNGVVTWADARAQEKLGLKIGARLEDAAVAGTEEKLRAIFQMGAVDGWEVSLVVGGQPATVRLTAIPSEGGTVLLGSLVPQEFSQAQSQVAEAMSEISSLHRQVVARQKELEESNRGILSLHSELADQADTLRRALEVRKRIVANVSHELRTPLHSILGLSRLLLSDATDRLNDEDRKQLQFLRRATEELSQMVDDLLDAAKVDAGKMGLRSEAFEVADLFAALRGTLRPLVPPESPVALIFDPVPSTLALETDRTKVSQILRNLISNALKFTERGEVRVSAAKEDGFVRFSVKDTGIGIAREDLPKVFEEFGQVEGAVQSRVKGTGLGLPLSRQMAGLLGGSLEVESTPGEGSTFTVRIPSVHPEVTELKQLEGRNRDPGDRRVPVLVVEDDRKTIFLYDRYLSMSGFRVVPARTVAEARTLLRDLKPGAIILDIMLEGETSWSFLTDLKKDPATRDIPVMVVTISDKEQSARALGADEFWLKPVDGERLLRRLRGITPKPKSARVLVIDDDPAQLYIFRRLLVDTPHEVLEALTGPEGVRLAQEKQPHVIFLDFRLRDQTAFDVLDALKSNPRTRSIPVIINTSQVLEPEDKERLARQSESVLSKAELSRELAILRIRDALTKAGIA